MIIIRQEGSTTLYINPATIAMVKQNHKDDKILITTTYGKDIPLSGERAKIFMECFLRAKNTKALIGFDPAKLELSEKGVEALNDEPSPSELLGLKGDESDE